MDANQALQNLNTYLPVISALGGSLATWGFWSLRQKFVTRKRCEEKHGEIDTNMAGYDKRHENLAGLPAKLDGLIAQVAALSSKVDVQQESVNNLKGSVARVENQVISIENFLREVPLS